MPLSFGSSASADPMGITPHELTMLALLLTPGILLSVILMVTFAAGG